MSSTTLGPTPAEWFSWITSTSEEEFFREYFEKKPLLISRNKPGYYGCGVGSESISLKKKAPRREHQETQQGTPCGVDWSTETMLAIAGEKELHYTTDVNVVRFDKKLQKRVPFRTTGVVTKDDLQSCMRDGWSVRFLRPQEHRSRVGEIITALEEFFACSGGCNSYWTPGGSQGFAPHYDDVDVFLLQLEGEKDWKLHAPLSDVDHLARHSSEDYTEAEVGPPILTTTLRAGDMLYMPRGTIHQGKVPASATHSLHVTFSANQMHTWADLVQAIFTNRVETLAANDLRWRRTIPRDWFTHLGVANSKDFREANGLPVSSENRAALLKKVKAFAAEVSTDVQKTPSVDLGVDWFARSVLGRRQPPPPRPPAGAGNDVEVGADDLIRLVSAQCMRIDMSCPGEARVHHVGNNSRICMAAPLAMLRFEADFAPALGFLLGSYPNAVAIGSLPMPAFENEEDAAENRLVLAETLRDANVAIIEAASHMTH